MAEQFVTVNWNDHPIELSTLCRTLLENNYLVDCTISAEGQCLKVHRLVLSACSPYFHMLFNDEQEKHPIVVLFDASFETVKAVIDFVYCGETQIPQRNLKAFLALAHALQIKGLNDVMEKDGNKGLSGSSAGNVSCPSKDNQNYNEVQRPRAKPEDRSGDLCEQHLHFSDDYTDAQTSSSVPFKGCNDSWENVHSGSVVPPRQRQQILPECDELAIETEISVKHEPLFSEILEPKNDSFDNVETDKSKIGNFKSGIEEETSEFGQQDLNQYSSSGETGHGYEQSASVMPLPLQLLEQQIQQQQDWQLMDKFPVGPEVAEHSQPLLPVVLVPKCEQLEDTERQESMEANDVFESNTNQMEADAEPALREHVNQNSSAVGSPAALKRGQRGIANKCSYCSKTFRTPALLRKHELTHTDPRPFMCNECGVSFTSSGHLRIHERAHTGQRPYKCNESGATFSNSGNLRHAPVHTGERRFKCSVCPAAFSFQGNLVTHMRIHTGERPCKCNVCGASFRSSSSLSHHKRIHTGERPYKCRVCGAAFAEASNMKKHMRVHTGERRFRCDTCSGRFSTKFSLERHCRLQHPLLQN